MAYATEEAALLEVEEMNYRELQLRAGDLGLKKTGKTDELRERVLSAMSHQTAADTGDQDTGGQLLSDPEDGPASPRSGKKRTTAPKSVVRSSRKRTKAAEEPTLAQTAHDRLEDVKDQAGSAAGHAHKAAGGVMHFLQRTPHAVYQSAAKTCSSLKDSVKRVHLSERFQEVCNSMSPSKASPLRRSKRVKASKAGAAPASRWHLPSLRTSLLLLLTALAIFGATLYAAKPHEAQQWAASSWHKLQEGAATGQRAGQDALHSLSHSSQSALHSLSKGGQSALRGVSQGSHRALHGSQRAAQRFWQQLKGLVKLTRDPMAEQRDRLTLGIVDGMLPKQPQWEGLRGSLHDLLAGHRLDASKAPAVLMVGSEAASHQAAAYLVVGIFRRSPEKAHCTLLLRGKSLSSGDAGARAQLQAQLTSLLETCPHAIVVLDGVQKMHPGLLPVWINALSEQGGFTSNGQHVSSKHALFFFTAAVPGDILSLATEEKLAAAAKEELGSVLHQKRETPVQSAEVLAFRRRLDLVVPLQS